MRGKVIGLAIVVLALLLLATPGLVAAKKQAAPRFFSLDGEITQLGGSIWVDVLDGNPLVPAGNLQVFVTDDTDYYECTGAGRKTIQYDALVVEDLVFIHGTVSGSVFTAERVIVDKPD